MVLSSDIVCYVMLYRQLCLKAKSGAGEGEREFERFLVDPVAHQLSALAQTGYNSRIRD